ncbi:uncharacterized protein EI90DRAFT_3019441 [Cantharellus anzutake]|uniref:uncharacterized protein n=1 Tax=Cantharellus anzutake TaxID=1750568 RepID=UPI001908F666|nr:uncharacterized protein EI90DRAFT_3019441 [Cantharellus anzutake]KAF8324683.1 hypothetical protein EI90DRAFT_3019441 [Cantharellus anzutake]
MIPVLIKRSFVQLPTDGMMTRFDHRSMAQYPKLELTDKGSKASTAGMIPILNGRHWWEAMKIAFRMCNDEIPKLKMELAGVEKQLKSEPENLHLKHLSQEYCSDLEQQQLYLEKYDDKWLVIAYDQETVEKDGVEGSLAVLSLSWNVDMTTVEETLSDQLQYWAQSIMDEQSTLEESEPTFSEHWSGGKHASPKGSWLPHPLSHTWIEKDAKAHTEYVNLLQDEEI